MRRAALRIFAGVCVLAGCASTPEGEPPNPDPLESVNRPIFRFNDVLDRFFLNPLAVGWDFITPRTVPHHFEQLLDNLRTPGWALNDLFQGEVKQSGVEWSRFLINTSVGIGGIFDPAHHFLSLADREEDFGQTLGVWGVGPGPYLMLPILGPSGGRELAALPFDTVLNPLSFVPGANFVYAVNRRSMRLDEVRNARASALDLYSSLRDAYRQSRQSQIANGQESEEVPDDLYELEEDVPE